MSTSSVAITIGKVVTAIVFLAMLALTVYCIVIQLWIGVASAALLAAGFGYMSVRDLRQLIAERK